MVTLQPRLNVRLSQKQILTPGLVQMVSVLALNKLELRDMITAEMVENPVLEELESSVPLLDDISRREEERDRQAAAEIKAGGVEADVPAEKKDPFDEIDFGAYFQEYLDPGFRSRQEWEEVERPSYENFLSRPSTLTDHLMWQLSAERLRPEVEEAAELIIGNLNEEGYLTASNDELLGLEAPPVASEISGDEITARAQSEAAAIGMITAAPAETTNDVTSLAAQNGNALGESGLAVDNGLALDSAPAPQPAAPSPKVIVMPRPKVSFDRKDLAEALEVVRQMDPVGVACRTLQECLLAQIRHHQQVEEDLDGDEGPNRQMLADCAAIITSHLRALQRKEYRDIARAISRPLEAVLAAVEDRRPPHP